MSEDGIVDSEMEGSFEKAWETGTAFNKYLTP